MEESRGKRVRLSWVILRDWGFSEKDLGREPKSIPRIKKRGGIYASEKVWEELQSGASDPPAGKKKKSQ